MDELDILKTKIANNEILLLEYESDKKILINKNINLENDVINLKQEYDSDIIILKSEYEYKIKQINNDVNNY